jgi:hypothetical protein
VRARALAAALAAWIVLAAAGCGEGEDDSASTAAAPSDPAAPLTAAERDALDRGEAAILRYCRARALSLTDPDERPTVGKQARALEAVDAMVALASEKPAARVGPRVDLLLYLGDLAEDLEGSNCDPQIVTRLDEGLAALPGG